MQVTRAAVAVVLGLLVSSAVTTEAQPRTAEATRSMSPPRSSIVAQLASASSPSAPSPSSDEVRSRRLVRSGNALLLFSLVGLAVGTGITLALYEPCDESDFCLFDRGFGVAITASVVVPIGLVGLIIGSVGRERRARMARPRLDAALQRGDGTYGVRLNGSF